MSTSPPERPRATRLAIDDDELALDLADGRRLLVPLAWFPRLRNATPEQRADWRWIGNGLGIHWPSIDEDVSVAALLAPAARGAA